MEHGVHGAQATSPSLGAELSTSAPLAFCPPPNGPLDSQKEKPPLNRQKAGSS